MENCKGCHTYHHLTISCSASIINNSDKCPCVTCLVKAVCNKACGEYRIFSGRYSSSFHLQHIKKETT